MENSERLGREMRPGFEPGTSHLLVLSTTTPLLVRLSETGKGANDGEIMTSSFLVEKKNRSRKLRFQGCGTNREMPRNSLE